MASSAKQAVEATPAISYTYIIHTCMQVCGEQCEAGSGGYTCYFRPADSLFGLLRQNLADSRVDSVGALLSSLALLALLVAPQVSVFALQYQYSK